MGACRSWRGSGRRPASGSPAAFATPTAAQVGAWQAISAGQHALVVAPTGSGKTLAAFLWSLDRLATNPPADPARRCRVLYVSPLKALAVDVERNLRTPLTGIRQAAARLGEPMPDIQVAMRTGDTPADERRAFMRTPPDILITTPESLYLLLTSPGAGVAARRRDRDRRRGPRGLRDQARRPPRALARAARRAAGNAGPADRAVGHGPADRRDGPVPRRATRRSRSSSRRPPRPSRSRSRCRSRT